MKYWGTWSMHKVIHLGYTNINFPVLLHVVPQDPFSINTAPFCSVHLSVNNWCNNTNVNQFSYYCLSNTEKLTTGLPITSENMLLNFVYNFTHPCTRTATLIHIFHNSEANVNKTIQIYTRLPALSLLRLNMAAFVILEFPWLFQMDNRYSRTDFPSFKMQALSGSWAGKCPCLWCGFNKRYSNWNCFSQVWYRQLLWAQHINFLYPSWTTAETNYKSLSTLHVLLIFMLGVH
jgi:hypothetical protein